MNEPSDKAVSGAGSALLGQIQSLAKGVSELNLRQQQFTNTVDSLSEVVSVMLYCLENSTLTFENFQKSVPEVQARRLDSVLEQLFKQNVAQKVDSVEVGTSVMTTGYNGDQISVLRKSFSVTETENTVFVGAKVGDEVKLTPDSPETYKVLVAYKPVNA